jgi:hypothetical protein
MRKHGRFRVEVADTLKAYLAIATTRQLAQVAHGSTTFQPIRSAKFVRVR